jgi:3-phenylpropionate/trans-cinnamate dioxygenase ferredoxin reductase component
MSAGETYLLIGGGYGSSRAAECLREEGFQGRIVIVSEEQHLPYSRPPLCKRALKTNMDITRLPLRHAPFYAKHNVELLLGRKVVAIDRHARRVEIEKEGTLDYDKLLIATGGRSRRIAIPGNELRGIHAIRTYEDTVAFREDFVPGKRLVIIGGGYIGLETAAAARQVGLDVTLIHRSARLMGRVAASVTSEFFARYHMDHGVKLLLHRNPVAFEGADGHVGAVLLEDGERVPADAVLTAVGNIPEFRLALEAGLECDGGVVVDDRCRTSDPLIFAAGDCTRHPSVRYGRRIQLESVDNALEQARVASAGMCGRRIRHSHVPWFWSDQYDLKFQIVGLPDGFDEVVVRGDPDEPGFSIWYLRDDEVLCMETVNNQLEFMQAGRWIGAKAKVDAHILRNAAQELDDAVINKEELLRVPISA